MTSTNRLLGILAVLVGTNVALQFFSLYRDSRSISLRQPTEPGETVQVTAREIELPALPFIGSRDASVAIVEFSDFECPFCNQHAKTVLGEIRSRLISTGKVRYLWVNMPLDSHRNARSL